MYDDPYDTAERAALLAATIQFVTREITPHLDDTPGFTVSRKLDKLGLRGREIQYAVVFSRLTGARHRGRAHERGRNDLRLPALRAGLPQGSPASTKPALRVLI